LICFLHVKAGSPARPASSHPQVRPFVRSQPASVDRRQTGAVGRNPDRSQRASHLLPAQNHRQLLFPRRTHQLQGAPLLPERLLVEKLDPANRHGRRRSRDLPLVETVFVATFAPILPGPSAHVFSRVRPGVPPGALQAGRIKAKQNGAGRVWEAPAPDSPGEDWVDMDEAPKISTVVLGNPGRNCSGRKYRHRVPIFRSPACRSPEPTGGMSRSSILPCAIVAV
jgi:hypothetical protein